MMPGSLFLGLDYVWPQFTSDKANILIFLFIGIAFVLFLMYYIGNQQLKSRVNWNQLLKYAYSHKLNSVEIKIIEEFFKKKDLGIHGNINLVLDKRKFHSDLFDFLDKHDEVSREASVIILDKLFPENKSELDIKSLNEIVIGEPCSVDIGDELLLGYVLKKSVRELFISVRKFPIEMINNPGEIRLYFYRPELGGYFLNGALRKVRENGFIFTWDGEINISGERHLMITFSLTFKLIPWEIKAKEIENTDVEKEIFGANCISGSTDKISSHAILMKFNEFSDLNLLKKYDLWDIEIELPGKGLITLEGKIAPSSSDSSKHIFKYINIHEEEKKTIMNFIMARNPVREEII